VNKLANSKAVKNLTAGIIFLTLLFPAFKKFIEILITNPAADSLWYWSFYAFFLMLSCFGIIIYLYQTHQLSKETAIPKTLAPEPINDNNKEELKKKLSETEAALRNVIANLTIIIADIKNNMDQRDSSLEIHKENIIKAKSIGDYVKISDVLLGEISEIIESNKTVREKLKNSEEIIKEQNKNLAKLITETMTDHLTTILNKRGFDKRLDEEYIRFKRYNGKLSLITLDVDHFKLINDTHGHIVGDKALRSFAQLLKRNIRESDILARVGGEEFSILLPETDLEGATNAAKKIHELLQNSIIKINGSRIKISASFGVSVLKNGESKTNLIDRADQALYISKKLGRNRISTEKDISDKPNQ
jgi:diguanylate cyclase